MNEWSLIDVFCRLSYYYCVCVCAISFIFQWRSPEEYAEINHNEQIDVYSLGNNFFGMLTGLEPFWEEDDDYDKLRIRVMQGEKAPLDRRFFDPQRNLAESKLAEIIDQCHEFDPEKRPTIFQVVDFLQNAMTEVDNAAADDMAKAPPAANTTG
jgi:serine/threonine protein kinase